MNVAIGTHHRPSDPLGVVAVLSGVAGFVSTFVLWLYQMRPTSAMGSWLASELAVDRLHEDLIVLAALCGTVAIVGAVLSSFGGPARSSTVAAILLGATALTYPVLAWQGVVGMPVTPPFSP
ncbi:MAG TPA: hypothetical protein VG993_11705 [Actinomycetota bacterium]|jgi:hypothetical protein|nr:hypothetical protein [Actinomycetota bacterium]